MAYGTECHRWSTVGHLCAQHARLLLGVEVRLSGIPGAGEGLFVVRDFPRGHVLCEYKGRIVSRAQWLLHPSAYGVKLYTGETLDAVRTSDGFARYANSAMRAKDVNGQLISGAKLGRRGEGKRIYLQLTKAVKAGTEVLIAYGDEYSFPAGVHGL